VRFIDDCFPLIVTISAPVFDAAEVRAMADGFEPYFARGEQYAVLSAQSRNAPVPGARERKMIAEWANHPRTLDFSRRLCVGSAVVVGNPLTRATLSIIMSIWKPASPFQPVSTVEKGLDYCLGRIHAEGLKVSKPIELIRYEILREVSDLV
jgi:hypothetical protein